jgi:hypothetical protein
VRRWSLGEHETSAAPAAGIDSDSTAARARNERRSVAGPSGVGKEDSVISVLRRQVQEIRKSSRNVVHVQCRVILVRTGK